MGCAQSKIDNEESVSRCKDRKLLIKEALAARNAFAAAHSSYAIALKDTGVALNGYAHGEASAANIPDTSSDAVSAPSAVAPPPPPPPQDELPPPPPPLPSFTPSPSSLQRSATMPEFSVSKRGISKMGSISIPEKDGFHDDQEEDEDEERQGVKEIEGFGSGKKIELKQNGVMANGGDQGGGPMPWDYFFMNMPEPAMGGGGTGEIEEEDEDGDEDEEEEDDEEEEVKGRNNAAGGGIGYGGFARKEMNAMGGGGEFDFQTPEKPTVGFGKMEAVDEEMEMESPTPVAPNRHFLHSNTAPPELRMAGANLGGGSKNSAIWFKVLKEIDDYFLKASDSAKEVSMMLEATRFQYHANFADPRVPVDHAARVMRVITWNRPVNGVAGGGDRKDDHYAEESETHAIVLDKLLAWEKKLYDEVKAGELMKLEYHRKVGVLNKQKKRGASTESLEKTKAVVSHLHTRYIVDMQSMDSTVSEVNDLRDRQLYPKLVELVDGMAKMWEDMYSHHDNQLQLVTNLKSLDISLSPRETSMDHHAQTVELRDVVEGWKSQFEKLTFHQKQYIQFLNSWLKLNLIPIETTLKEKVSSPPRIQTPPIQPLLQAWNDILEKLPDELVRTAISSFVAVIDSIIVIQQEEMKLKEKCMETQKEFLRKSQAFEDWYHKHGYKHSMRALENAAREQQHGNGGDGGGGAKEEEEEEETAAGAIVAGKDPVSDRKYVVDSLKKRMLEEVEAHQRQCLQVREKSLGSLKNRLPELFRALSDFSHACADGYNRLRGVVVMSHSSARPS